METSEFMTSPAATHAVYIPLVLIIGMVVGFVLGRRVGIRQGQDDFLAGGTDDDRR